MIIKLKNTDFSNNPIGVIVANGVEQKTNITAYCSLGTVANNGDKLSFTIKITSIGTFSGSSVSFFFCSATNATSASSFLSPNPVCTFNNVSVGDEYSGEIDVAKLDDGKPYLNFGTSTLGGGQIKYDLEYAIIRKTV